MVRPIQNVKTHTHKLFLILKSALQVIKLWSWFLQVPDISTSIVEAETSSICFIAQRADFNNDCSSKSLNCLMLLNILTAKTWAPTYCLLRMYTKHLGSSASFSLQYKNIRSTVFILNLLLFI